MCQHVRRSASLDCRDLNMPQMSTILPPPPVQPGFFPPMTLHPSFRTLCKPAPTVPHSLVFPCLPESSLPRLPTPLCAHLSLASSSCSVWVWTKWVQSPVIIQEWISAGFGGSSVEAEASRHAGLGG